MEELLGQRTDEVLEDDMDEEAGIVQGLEVIVADASATEKGASHPC
jgi:hypothetical protein